MSKLPILSRSGRRITLAAVGVALATVMAAGSANAQEAKFRLGIVTFLSGPAAGPFGVPAANAAELMVKALNNGDLPAPYNTKGINGLQIETVVIDEAGGATKQVEELRNLVQRQNVDAVIGYISSGDCLAVSPVAETLKTLTILFDCGTSRLFVDNANPRYVFRTGLDASIDNIGAARYLAKTHPKAKRISGIQQNYSFGQESWADFEAAVQKVMPDSEIVAAQFPKIYQGSYGAEISALSVARPDIVHSSFWGGDMEAFVLQANARGLLSKATAVLTCGETGFERLKNQAPNGTVIGGRGPFGAFAPSNPLNDWFAPAFRKQFNTSPTYPASKMAQAILGLKFAAEQAAKPGQVPSAEAIAEKLANASFPSVSGTVEMARAHGHQAVQGISYGEYHYVDNKPQLKNVVSFSAACVTAPDGTTAGEWIKQGFPGATCD